MYYYVNMQFNDMKILPSSPYAVFDAKEWDDCIYSRKKNNQNNTCNLDKYYKNFKKYNMKKSAKKEIKKIKLIQLSFA